LAIPRRRTNISWTIKKKLVMGLAAVALLAFGFNGTCAQACQEKAQTDDVAGTWLGGLQLP
jgi:hypothetical protein